MRNRTMVFSLFLSVCFLLGCASTSPKKETKAPIALLTDDQKEVEATFYPAPSPNAAGVILLPDTRCDRRHFGNIPSRLRNAGFAVLAMDFRYKELISKTRSREASISTLKKQNLYSVVDYDVKTALDFMSKQKGVNPARICLIGTSFGSRIALLAGAKYKVRGLVLVSLSGNEALPGGKPIKSLLQDYGERPIFFVTAEKDWGGNYKAAENNRQYFEWAKGPKELKIWSGTGHGVELIKPKDRFELLAQWLRDCL